MAALFISGACQRIAINVRNLNVMNVKVISNDYASGGNSIKDGGKDMYDSGNCISVPATTDETASCSNIENNPRRQSNPKLVTYKDNCAIGTVNGETYEMSMMNSGISVLTFSKYKPDTISVNGNLGADGGGKLSTGSYQYNGWKGFWKVVWRARGDAGVNHLWVTNAPSAKHTFRKTNKFDWDQLSDISGYDVTYLMWATVPDSKTEDFAMQQLVIAVVGNNFFTNKSF